MDHFLAIMDRDKKYIKKLGSYLNSKGNIPFETFAFDDEAKLLGYLIDHEGAILLIHEDFYQEQYKQLTDKVVFLVNRREDEVLEGKETSICKYQSGDAIAKKIMGICASDTKTYRFSKRVVVSENRAQIIGLYSPIKRSLQTSFSFVYANLVSQKKRTLYLNFETFAGFSVWFERQYETDILDLIYFLEMGEEKFLLKLSGMVETMGTLHYIPPALSYQDFMEVKESQWIHLIETIATCGSYDVIVLDLNDQMNGLMGVLDLCDSIFTMQAKDSLSFAKMEGYKYWLRSLGKEQILEKTHFCRLPNFQGLPQDATKLTYSQLADFIRKEYGEVLP